MRCDVAHRWLLEAISRFANERRFASLRKIITPSLLINSVH
jgi:hypothetical protein